MWYHTETTTTTKLLLLPRREKIQPKVEDVVVSSCEDSGRQRERKNALCVLRGRSEHRPHEGKGSSYEGDDMASLRMVRPARNMGWHL